jgi:hypothetical protein
MNPLLQKFDSMYVNPNTTEKILSLLLEVAKCSFVRVTLFKNKRQISHELGELQHAILIDEPKNVANNGIAHAQILHFGDYQFNVRIVSAQHAHIECMILLQADTFCVNTEALAAKPNNSQPRVSIFGYCTRIVIDLVHDQKLPDVIVQLTTHINTQVVTQLPETTPTHKHKKWLSSVLLKTILVSLESLQLVDHYLELTGNSLSRLHPPSQHKGTLQAFPKHSLRPDDFSVKIDEALFSVFSPNKWCLQFSQSVGDLLLSLNSPILLTVPVGSTIELVLLNMVHKDRLSHAKTAVLLQMPVSTARRKLQKPMPNLLLFENDVNWPVLLALLTQIVTNQVQLNRPLDIIKNIIAQSILVLHTANMGMASQLMGVSEPTMYKLRKQLQLYPLVY